ncbi:hypothetical protein [Burkholderia ubonensis]|uniref:hypothetical protein n=1 Tax=Burkholderia ubonensis TaxID=101571 RepID=UPI0039F5B9AB
MAIDAWRFARPCPIFSRMANLDAGVSDVFRALSEAEQWIAARCAKWEARSDRMAECVERHHAEEQADVTRTR